MTVDLAEVVPLLAALTVVLGGITAAYLGLRSWITKQAQPGVKAYEQVAPNGGSQYSTRHLIEETAADVADLKDVTQANRDIGVRAEAKADSALGMIQQHSVGHPAADDRKVE